MTLSAATRENSFNELNILFEINSFVYTRTSISNFIYENEINKQPYGEFILKDSGQLDEAGLQSGTYGIMYFTNSSDKNELKRMALSVYIDTVELVNKVDVFLYYKIKWSAGNSSHLSVRKNDLIAQSNSTDALRKVFELRNTDVEPYAGIRPSDTMNWIVVNKNMWEQLDVIVKKSLLANDYIFWAWDEVNSKFKISSISAEYAKNDENVIIRSTDSVASTSDVKDILSNNMVIWRYNNYKKLNTLGSSYKNIFPNVSFLGIPSGIIKTGLIEKQNFIEVLKNLNDTKINDVLTETKISPENAVFGELVLRKHTLNGHDFYAISDIYRDYKIATFAKQFVCQIYNTVGPQIGSCISLLHIYTNSYGNIEIDYKYSGKYFIKKKNIQYEGMSTNNMGRKVDAVTNYITTLYLVSDNYGDGKEHIEKVLEKTVV